LIDLSWQPDVSVVWFFGADPPGAYTCATVERAGRVEDWRPVPSPAYPHDQPNWQRVR
jgi:hypothetical protein